MSVIKFPYEPRKAPRKAILDEALIATILLRLMNREWLIADPMAGERTIERVGRRLGFTVVSSDIAEGVDARKLGFEDESVNCVFTHPPYWKATRYTDDPRDLSNAESYSGYLTGLKECFAEFYRILKPDGLLVLIIGDYRERKKFYPIHADALIKAREVGFEPVAIWVHEISASGTPLIGTKFMMSHEYVLIMKR